MSYTLQSMFIILNAVLLIIPFGAQAEVEKSKSVYCSNSTGTLKIEKIGDDEMKVLLNQDEISSSKIKLDSSPVYERKESTCTSDLTSKTVCKIQQLFKVDIELLGEDLVICTQIEVIESSISLDDLFAPKNK